MSDISRDMGETEDDRGGGRRMGSGLSDSDESGVGVIECVTQVTVLSGEGGDAFTKGCGLGDCGGETGGELVVEIGLRGGGGRGGDCVIVGKGGGDVGRGGGIFGVG